MEITYYGHSTFTIETSNTTILIDPFITPNDAVDIDIETFKPDYILATHGHEDHVADIQEIAKQADATLIAQFEVANWFADKGVTTSPVNYGGSKQCGDITVRMVTATHSSVLPDGSYGGNPAGFIIQHEDKTLYVSGDTDIHSDMNLFGDMYDIDLSILSIGGTFTMDVETAAKAMKLLQCEDAIGTHYNTFPPINIDEEEAKQTFEAQDYTLNLLGVEETYTL